MIKEGGSVRKKAIGLSQIFLIVSLSFAIAFILEESYVGYGSAQNNALGSAKMTIVQKGSTAPTATSISSGSYASSAGRFFPAGGPQQISIPNEFFTGNPGTVSGTYGGHAVGADGFTNVIVDGKTYQLNQYGTDEIATLGLKTSGAQQQSYSFLGKTWTGGTAHLLQGLQWAILVAGAVQLIGNLAGLEQDQTNALTFAAMGGIIAGKAFASLGQSGYNILGKSAFLNSGWTAFGVGVAVAAVIILLMYKDTDTEVVNFQCLPWEPVLGGANCEVCGQDGLPCSEYRCKSLGQACGLVNEGTLEEACVWISPNDVNSPTITPVTKDLEPAGLRYTPLKTRPDGIGTRIEPSGGGCLEAFSALQFGFETNEVAQCKIDFNRVSFEEMRFFVGETNSFLLNHTQRMSLPSPNDDSVASPLFENGGEFSLYMQCQDANGNLNEDHFIFEYCVDDSPDTTSPQIVDTSIINGGPVRYQVSEIDLDVYVNEKATCKWSRDDKSYDDMENTFSCSNVISQINGNQVYTCSDALTGVEDRKINDYFIRCKDDDGNTNVQSYPFSVMGTQPLNILSVIPNATEKIVGSTETVKLDLEIVTDDGAEEGKSICFYNNSLTQNFVEMFESNSFRHKQTQDLVEGNYNYNFRCVDAGGNIADQSTNFEVESDTESPRVIRVYRDTALKIVTNEDAECSYSLQDCNFNFNEGIKLEYSNIERQNELFAPWKNGNKYHIKCSDDFGNQPLPNSCSVIVSPRTLS